MCQGGPYQALSFLPDKGAILYALHQRAGETLVLNGAEDNLVAAPHHGESFFADLNTRVQALAGTRVPKIEYRFYPGVGHRPSWVNLDAATWLNARLHFPRWQNISLNSLGETHVAEWAATTGAHINHGYDSEKAEGGIRALGHGFPAPTRAELQAVPEAEWQAHQDLYTWQGWAKRTLTAEDLPANVPEPTPARPPRTAVAPPSRGLNPTKAQPTRLLLIRFAVGDSVRADSTPWLSSGVCQLCSTPFSEREVAAPCPTQPAKATDSKAYSPV
jgi:hypothetical protein